MRLFAILALLLFLVACAATQPFITVQPVPKNSAWYLRAQYHPFGSSIRGIPLNDLRENWCKANEFSRDIFPPELLLNNGKDILEQGGLSFSITGKFDDTNQLTALVGVYETCLGEKGTFLLIVKSSERNKSSKVFLAEFPRFLQFAALRPSRNDGIELWWCTSCDDMQELQWDEIERRFVWKSKE